ncbi:His Kinase A (phospho-acceptor) domain-containing protein [Flavobacteriaceae bacterium MAR_2010_188]|nr:His Kinase A (phospho-acceptor) domain-containing protein [Flavobacteriaceae bacterium MAR_2010_188]
MNLEKETHAEVKEVYDTWLHSYLVGDIAIYDSYLDDDYHFIGSTANEEFLNRKNTTNFLESTADQLAGKTKLENNEYTFEEFNGLIFITHLFDAWFLAEEWKYYGRFRFTSALRKNTEGWRFIYQHFSTPDTKAQEGETIGYEKISEENIQLRGAIKRRTIELEERNRQLEIEAALERVRTKAMSMDTSNDLDNTVALVFKELENLGLKTIRCGIGIFDDRSNKVNVWSASKPKDKNIANLSGDEYLEGHPLLDSIYENWTKQQDFEYTLEGQDLINYYKKVSKTNLPVSGPDKLRLDSKQYYYVAMFPAGGLFAFKETRFNAEVRQLMKRFSEVFHLAFIRHQDLMKAESQTKEAQVELALERVRAKTMAMQHSDKLQFAAMELFHQLEALKIPLFGCGFNIWDEDGETATSWMAGKERLQPSFKTSSKEDIFREIYESSKKGESLFVKEQKGKALERHYKYMASLPVFKEVIDRMEQTGVPLPSFQIMHCAFFTKGYLMVITHKNVSDAYNIFIRFAKVFDQTYTRFLDLKKAEAQAREAQIEAALERVRSRSLAMHKSDELGDLSFELVKQVQALGVATWFCAFNIYDDEKGSLEWGSNGEGVFPNYRTPREGIFLRYYKVGQSGETLLVNEIGEDECPAHYEYLCTLPGVGEQLQQMKDAGIPFPASQIDHVAFFKYGYIIFITYEPVPEAHNIFKRFAKVFEQSYTRFLDLKKAESQAREAEIQLALERVRARTMAMQYSEELVETSELLFQQIKDLGIEPWSCGFSLWYDDDSYFLGYNPGPDGKMGPPLKIPLTEDIFFKTIRKAKREGIEFLVFESKGKSLVKTYEYMDGLPVVGETMRAIVASGFDLPTYQVNHCGFFSHGHLMFITQEHYPEAHDIFIRFTREFEQTYTRFLDLQKAEAQAKEAQIEASLERVRSKTMAMHSSQDVGNTMVLLFEELESLGIKANRNGIIILDEEEHGEIWTAKPNINYEIELMAWQLDMSLHGLTKQVYKAWKNKNSGTIYPLIGDDLKAYYKTLNKYTDIPVKFNLDTFPEREWCYTFNFNEGFIYLFTDEEILQEHEQIPVRFASVFGQTYRRYQDLKKAEAQAREAKIEAALERVRSRSMAMHQSDEIGEVAKVLFEQLTGLGGELWGTGFAFCKKNSTEDEFWFVNERGIMPYLKIPNNVDSVHKKMHKGWQDQLEIFSIAKEGKELEAHYNYMLSVPDVQPIFQEMLDSGITFPKWQKWHAAYYKYGYLLVITTKPYEDEEIFIRFAKVFEQTYTRFLDLKKAESQTREAQINLAVERVRAKALAMHKSEEIMDVVAKLKEEVMALDIPDVIAATIFLKEGEDRVRMWDLSSLEKDNDGYQIPFDITFKLKKRDPNLYVKRVWENPENYFLEVQEEKDFKRICQWLRENNKTEVADEVEEFIETTQLKKLHHAVKKLNNGKLVIDLLNTPSDEMETILTKMGAAFDLAYKRFEDLQKAESQAREAQIEAALEKVRSQSLAMQKPEELVDVVKVIVAKLKELDVILDANGVILCTYFKDSKNVLHWIVSPDFSFAGSYLLPYFNHPIFNKAWRSKENGDAYFSEAFTVEEKNTFFEYAFEHSDYKDFPEDFKQWIFNNDKHTLSFAWQKNSAILIPSHTGIVPNEGEKEILKRFSNVFEQAYIRFMDLQKAEAQAREAQIEAALERVRSKAMAMRSSEDISEATTVLFREIEKLEIETMRCGILIIHENKVMDVWTSSSNDNDEVIRVTGQIDMTIHPLLINVYEQWQVGKSYSEFELSGKNGEDYYQALRKEANYELPTSFAVKDLHYCFSFNFKEGAFFAFTRHRIPEKAMAVFERFARVFGLTYQRYQELIESEKREKEAVKQSSLDRVRAEIASMRNTEDLERITPLIWGELLTLGVPFFRCGLMIINDNEEKVRFYLSTPEGRPLAALNLDYQSNDITSNGIKHWKKQQTYIAHWNKEEFLAFTKTLIEQQQIDNPTTYLGGEEAPESLTLQFVPFPQGMLYVGSAEDLSSSELDLVKNLANAFSVAYARYEDFNKLEISKLKIEQTLKELKSTQNQLIQSEKMASLGELTAGIAHEIQNPLNFVNNFSELSNELIDEMNAEIEKGDIEEAKFIAKDIKANLEKINHHGKRADSIVKGMLQHSRSNSGTKEPTNINKLADEYLRLAYHGLRAKDKSFNVNLVTDFDESIGKVSVIPQDLGRVILNLITNAFYAVDKKKKSVIENHEPTVKISTKKLQNGIAITVKDNGSGMPAEVVDKIFQPFFTTKPTGEGTGLGLSLCYDIIKAHNGEINVETQEGQGTTFILNLPYQE